MRIHTQGTQKENLKCEACNAKVRCGVNLWFQRQKTTGAQRLVLNWQKNRCPLGNRVYNTFD